MDRALSGLVESPGTIGEASAYFRNMLIAGINLNVVLAVFNLIPIPPLDGSHIVASLLPAQIAHRYRSIGFAGVFAVILLMNWQPFADFFQSVIEFVYAPYAFLYQTLR
jgi:Zn-dependent protease